ncbi:hypothetical protein SAMN05443144_11262 [Fodinibius roseus]|uniref:Uncharacterized protein n=1 Tax=Fodinibius roseus TaxID=1194090 RepID=A0A1M5DXX5_9BACT|nr:hypothetical protein [Fodinibius roseus]SHF71662.1 hypothetical protein SAMN05443144_11262 [Fodinibius roseus]
MSERTDSPESTDDPNTFMVNPTPPQSPPPEPARGEAYRSFVGTGMSELEPEKGLPKLQGEILFVNGYHSDSFAGNYHALLDITPDEPGFFTMRGDNASERDRSAGSDIFTSGEREAIEEMDLRERHLGQGDATGKTNDYVLGMFWGYWNSIKNDNKGSEEYARYFNAWRHDHYINGSHGLASNAAHRIDHGVALGYRWARTHWDIRPEEEVTSKKEQAPYVQSYSPPYRPVTLVAHSQGAAVGAGVALGLLRYAGELGWEQAALNMIYLGVHQPKGLCGEEYEQFIWAKRDYYGVDANFWEADPFSVWYGEDRQVYKFMNGIAELFSLARNKLKHRRGMIEHLQAITDWEAFKKRALQFTFSNDRGDLVCRDGDMPKMRCACNPRVDATLYSAEYFPDHSDVPAPYLSLQEKELIDLEEGGCLVVPAYAVIQRIHVTEDPDQPDGKKKEFWEDYRSVARDWGNALARYKRLKRQYRQDSGRAFEEGPLSRRYPGWDDHGYGKVARAHRRMLYHYGRLQHGDLFAHRSPVGLIHDPDLLGASGSFDDKFGSSSIWERIKKAGEDMFYRVEYDEDPDGGEPLDEEKREKDKRYVEDSESKKLLIDTSIAETFYIKNVIKAYVEGDESAEDQLYKEPDEA